MWPLGFATSLVCLVSFRLVLTNGQNSEQCQYETELLKSNANITAAILAFEQASNNNDPVWFDANEADDDSPHCLSYDLCNGCSLSFSSLTSEIRKICKQDGGQFYEFISIQICANGGQGPDQFISYWRNVSCIGISCNLTDWAYTVDPALNDKQEFEAQGYSCVCDGSVGCDTKESVPGMCGRDDDTSGAISPYGSMNTVLLFLGNMLSLLCTALIAIL